jgi:DNA invertase Pin-like site-specific DNA recombinase
MKPKFIGYVRHWRHGQWLVEEQIEAIKAEVAKRDGILLGVYEDQETGRSGVHDRPELDEAVKRCRKDPDLRIIMPYWGETHRDPNIHEKIRPIEERYVSFEPPRRGKSRREGKSRTQIAVHGDEERGSSPPPHERARRGFAITDAVATKAGRDRGRELQRHAAEKFRQSMRSIVEEAIEAKMHVTPQEIADYLNARSHPTLRGSEWSRQGAKNLLVRLGLGGKLVRRKPDAEAES